MITVNDREKVEWKDGITVSELLEIMGYSYVLITVTVNQEVIRAEDYDICKIPDNADVNIFHLAHGG